MSWRRMICFAVFLATNVAVMRTFGQNNGQGIDSLKFVLAHATSDTARINALLALGPTNDCNDTAHALRYATEALTLAKKTDWYQGCFNANNQISGYYYSCKKDYLAAATAYEASASIAGSHQHIGDEATSIERAAFCYYSLGRYKTALDRYKKTLALKAGVGIDIGVYANMGAMYEHVGDLTNALANYLTSISLQDTILHSKKTVDVTEFGQKAGLLLSICDVYFAMGQPDKAYDNFQQVINISHKVGIRSLEIQGLMGLAHIDKMKKDYPQSIFILDSALAESEQASDLHNKVDILNEQAGVYLEMDNYPSATKCAQDALALAEANGFTQQLPRCYLTLGQVYARQNNNTKAAAYLEHAVTIDKSTGELEGEKNALDVLSSVYEKMGRATEALAAYRSYISIRDSVYNIDKANELTRLDLEHAFSEEKIKQAAAFNETIARQRILTYCGYGGLALVLLLAFFIYKNYNTQKKYNLLLKKEQIRQEAYIHAQDNVLGKMAHAQSHYVRGPISTILGLLLLYNHEDPADPFNKEIMDGISAATEKLDAVVKDAVEMENNRRWGQKG